MSSYIYQQLEEESPFQSNKISYNKDVKSFQSSIKKSGSRLSSSLRESITLE